MSLIADVDLLSPATPTHSRGLISLVGAGPGAADLLTARALQRINSADVVYYDRLVSTEVLSLIPANVRRVNVGKEVGNHAWPQEAICAVIVDAALQGQRVVRLKSGDPAIFGRAGEELAAARAHGIDVEIVPGITAASAAASALCEPLTERGRFDRLLIATGTTMAGDTPEQLASSLAPGTRLVLYMAVQHLSVIAQQLVKSGLSTETGVTVISHVSSPKQQHGQFSLGELQQGLSDKRLSNPAIVMIDVPHLTGVSLARDQLSLTQA